MSFTDSVEIEDPLNEEIQECKDYIKECNVEIRGNKEKVAQYIRDGLTDKAEELEKRNEKLRDSITASRNQITASRNQITERSQSARRQGEPFH
jgi:FtsZ-binding cell division protein ZapB